MPTPTDDDGSPQAFGQYTKEELFKLYEHETEFEIERKRWVFRTWIKSKSHERAQEFYDCLTEILKARRHQEAQGRRWELAINAVATLAGGAIGGALIEWLK